MKHLKLEVRRDDTLAELPFYVDAEIECDCGSKLEIHTPVIPEFKGCLDLTCSGCLHRYHIPIPTGE